MAKSAPNHDPIVVPKADSEVSRAKEYPELRTPIILENPEHAGA